MNTLVKVGLEVLLHNRLDLLRGRRLGLVSHPAAITSKWVDLVDALRAAGLRPTTLFGPEHGYTAAVGDGVAVANMRDPHTGLLVYSLYGETQEPTEEMLRDVDILIFDMQDLGVRFYTYLSTLYYLLQACSKTGCPMVVLDRPNPITGTRVHGPLLEKGWESFVGIIPVPVMHGMTLGELSRLINGEYGLGVDLTVIPLEGWQRRQWFDDTGRIWVPTSPGMPRLETAVVYPGMCFLEGTNLSEGRGTAQPFELAGAPWMNSHRLADRLTTIHLPGVVFRPVHFQPYASKYRGQVCQGVQVHVLDRDIFDPLRVGLEVITACWELAPSDFTFLPPDVPGGRCHFDLLAGSDGLRLNILDHKLMADIFTSWQPGLADFCLRRAQYLLYE